MNDQKAQNREMCRYVRKELGRFPVDCSDVQIDVHYGNVTLHGRVRPMVGHGGEEFDTSLHLMIKAIHNMRGVREVHPDWIVAA